jgi:plastocyanin
MLRRITRAVYARLLIGLARLALLLVNDTTHAQFMKIAVRARGWPIETGGDGPHFNDVPTDHPFYDFIETAWYDGLTTGYKCGGEGEPCPGVYFRPNAKITRAEMCKIVVLAHGLHIDTSGGPHFTDVPTEHLFYNFIETAWRHGFIKGYSDNTFRPNKKATSGEMAVLLSKAIVTPPAPALASVRIKDSAFVPQDMTISAGTPVRWTNFDSAQHTSRSDSGIWDSGTLDQNQFYMLTLDSPGEYPYHCAGHPTMTGTITVNAPTTEE